MCSEIYPGFGFFWPTGVWKTPGVDPKKPLIDPG